MRVEGSAKVERRGDAPDVGHEVQYSERLFAFAQAKTAAELLHEDAAAVRDAEEPDEVEVGNVDPLVEDIDGGHDRYPAQPEAR